MKNLRKKEFGKVLAGVLSCCMLLISGCEAALAPRQEAEIGWEWEEESMEEIPVTAEAMLCIYVCGAVKNPGVYQLAEGSRLFEAIDAAGGTLPEADLTSRNLAKVLQDGEQITVLTKEEAKALEESGETLHKGLVNINTASVQELTGLTGIGESRAQAIVAYRETNGLFKSIDGIKKVTGIKDGLFEKIKDKICI